MHCIGASTEGAAKTIHLQADILSPIHRPAARTAFLDVTMRRSQAMIQGGANVVPKMEFLEKARHLRAGRVHDERTHTDNQPSDVRERRERNWRNHAPVGMPPVAMRFEGTAPLGRRAHDRLIDEKNFAIAEPTTNARLRCGALDGLRCLLAEADIGAFAPLLRAVPSRCGALDRPGWGMVGPLREPADRFRSMLVPVSRRSSPQSKGSQRRCEAVRPWVRGEQPARSTLTNSSPPGR